MTKLPAIVKRFRAWRYKSPEQIVKTMIKNILKDDEAVQSWRVPKEDLILGHHSIGRSIRNRFHLWAEANPYTSAEDAQSPAHPDQVSMTIMEQIWQHFNQGEQLND